jgi:transcriptional regulator
MPAPNLQGTLDLLVLTTLARGPNHGFGIASHVQEASEGLLNLEEGSLYPALRRLERDGLLAAEWKVSENGRRARYYKLTSAGHKALDREHQQWDDLRRGVKKVLRHA